MKIYQITWFLILVFSGITFIPLSSSRWKISRLISFILALCILLFQEWMLSIPLKIRVDLLVFIPLLTLSFSTVLYLTIGKLFGFDTKDSLIILRKWRRTYDLLVIPVWIISLVVMKFLRGNVYGIEILGSFYWFIPLLMVTGVVLKNLEYIWARYLFLTAVPIEFFHVSIVAMSVGSVNQWLVTIESIVGFFYLVGLIIYGSLISARN